MTLQEFFDTLRTTNLPPIIVDVTVDTAKALKCTIISLSKIAKDQIVAQSELGYIMDATIEHINFDTTYGTINIDVKVSKQSYNKTDFANITNQLSTVRCGGSFVQLHNQLSVAEAFLNKHYHDTIIVIDVSKKKPRVFYTKQAETLSELHNEVGAGRRINLLRFNWVAPDIGTLIIEVFD